MWQPPAGGSHLAHFGSSASAASLCAPARVKPDVCGWLALITLHVFKKLEPALPSSPSFPERPPLDTDSWEICILPRPGLREQSGAGDQGVRWPGPGTAPSRRRDMELRVTPSL